jgi:hypothetical protein
MKEVEKLLDEIENKSITNAVNKKEDLLYATTDTADKYKQLIMDMIKTVDDINEYGIINQGGYTEVYLECSKEELKTKLIEIIKKGV